VVSFSKKSVFSYLWQSAKSFLFLRWKTIQCLVFLAYVTSYLKWIFLISVSPRLTTVHISSYSAQRLKAIWENGCSNATVMGYCLLNCACAYNNVSPCSLKACDFNERVCLHVFALKPRLQSRCRSPKQEFESWAFCLRQEFKLKITRSRNRSSV